ncbi:MAG: adenosine kinase [Actinobacteria bacterium]|nr:adenosine kinase [Actinomycetota bacterium]
MSSFPVPSEQPGLAAPSGREPGGCYDVVGIGNALVDIVAVIEESELALYGQPKGTMALVDSEPADAIYAKARHLSSTSGGSAANTMVGLAALGARCAFMGRVANDSLGELFASDLAKAGVEFLSFPGGQDSSPLSTGRCLVLVTPDAERTMLTHLGAAAHLRKEDLDMGALSRARFAYLEGYLWDLPEAKDALRVAAARTHQAGGQVVLTLSDPFCVERHRSELLELVSDGVDVLLANEAEICLLVKAHSFEDAVKEVKGLGVRCGGLTRGAQGSVVVFEDEALAVPALACEEVVDTTGAGDLYAAGFLYGLTIGADPETCGRLGSLCAGEVISHLGARPLTPLGQLAREAGLLF